MRAGFHNFLYTVIQYCAVKRTIRDGIHESKVSFRFLGIILRFLRLEVSTFVFALLYTKWYSWVFFIDWLFFRYSSFRYISNGCLYGEKMYLLYMQINCNKRRNNASFTVKRKDNVNKVKTPPTFSCCYRNLKSKKTIGGSKIRWWRWLWISWIKSIKFVSWLRTRISHQLTPKPKPPPRFGPDPCSVYFAIVSYHSFHRPSLFVFLLSLLR
jgi:hypothetical protein